jgi:membrane-associated phospholipid phosphatase
MTVSRHKTRTGTCILLLASVLGVSGPLAAQAPIAPRAIQVGDVASSAVAAALVLAPRVFSWGPTTADCTVPCDPATLPWYDRWALSPISPTLSRGSDVLVVALGLGTVAATVAGDRSHRELVSALQAGLWAEGATEMLKTTVGRERPVLYTAAGADVATVPDNLRSLPSGHTAVAFSLATSLWLAERDIHGRPGLVGWLGVLGATGVAVLRVAAGKHFPSDVVVGAAVGTASSLVVHAIKF